MEVNQVKDPKLVQILNQIKSFGFSFYAFSEDGTPLVKGPNSQIVEINIAINFVNKQIQLQKTTDSGDLSSPENMPENMPVMPKPLESTSEKIAELHENKIEQKSEKANRGKERAEKEIDIQKKAPLIRLPKKDTKPYGDGFDPKSFDPNDIRKTMQFIQKNSKKKNTSAEKWLATLFKKFIDEVVAQK